MRTAIKKRSLTCLFLLWGCLASVLAGGLTTVPSFVPSPEAQNDGQSGDGLVEIPQKQSPEISDGASRADMVVGEEYTTYTTKSDICVIVKMYNVDVKDCDYILFQFAAPLPSGIKAAFWSQGGTDNVSVPEGVTEYKYVFAEDSKCAVKNGILPQVTLLTIYAGSSKTVKIKGIYKHQVGEGEEEDPLATATDQLNKALASAKCYPIGTGLGQYSGIDTAPLVAEAEAYLATGDCEVEKVKQLASDLQKALGSLSLNLPAAGSQFRLYCPALKSYVSATAGATRLKMVSSATASTIFTYDGKHIINKATGLYTATYDLKKEEPSDYVFIIPAYGDYPGLYSIEYMGGEKERVLRAEAAGSDCNRHFLISQSGYEASSQNATAFELQLVSGDVVCPENMTGRLTNPSFETGDLTGWVYTAISGADAGVKPNSDGVYHCTGTDGDYLFNTWKSSDSRVSETEDHVTYQTLYDMPEGEYRLEVLLASNQSRGITVFANGFTQNAVPRGKDYILPHRLGGIYVTPQNRSLTLGVRSATWYRCDNFVLTYMGKTAGYEQYVKDGYADASIMAPVLFDMADGQSTRDFTYVTEAGTPEEFSVKGGLQNDGTQVDRSLLQAWTASTKPLANGTISTTYTQLPDGYYKVSSAVRVYDQYGTFNNPVKGLKFFAGDVETDITTGEAPAAGNLKAKGIAGEYAIIAKVEGGELQAGFKLKDASFNWLGWQGFRLEYIGTSDPAEVILNLNLPADQYVALCVPYSITPDYFGPIYKVVNVADGKAQLVPSHEKSVPAGTPVVVKATGKNPDVAIGSIQVNNGTPGSVLTYWNNTLLKGDYDGWTWTADMVDRTQLKGNELTFEELDLDNINATISHMNRAAQLFWDENAGYTTSSASTINNYLNEKTWNRRDQPNPIIIPLTPVSKTRRLYYSTDPDFGSGVKNVAVSAGAETVELYNLIPDLTYYFYVGSSTSKDVQGQFTVSGKLRMIMVGDHVYNCRDLGGKKTVDGKYVRYGKIFRNGELNGGYVATADEIKILKNLGVGSEIDLRGEIDNSGAGTSAFGFRRGTTFYYVGGDHYLADEATKMDTNHSGNAEAIKYWKEEIEFVAENLRAGRGVDFHCRIGADRTGCLGMLLLGLMGVTESDLIRDYETTSFSTAAGTRVKNNTFDTGLKFIKAMTPAGGTLRDAFDKYATSVLGVSQKDIDDIRSIMLLDEPEAVGIDDLILTPNPVTTNATYDLAGRKVNAIQPGIMIRNGRKLLVR